MYLRKYFFAIVLLFVIQQISGQNSQSLSGKWKVVWNDGNKGYNDLNSYIHFNPLLDSLRYVIVDVPMDLNLAMQKRGMFGDINFGTNSLAASWVSHQYWQYYRYFTIPREALNKPVFLVFDRLDYNATILINGQMAGSHKNAYTPCRIDITGKLKEGPNLITVSIESGLFDVAEREGAIYNDQISTVLNKRHWLRKPQYQFSWDWNPTMINIGITGDVRLEWKETARLDQIVTFVKMRDDLSSGELTIRPFIEGLASVSDISVEATLLETGQKVIVRDSLTKRLKPFELKMQVSNPKLWWPAGCGAQNLYTVKVEVMEKGKLIDSGTRRIGFRKIEVDRSAHPVEGNYFTIKINNRKVFMKGGNWVPADMIYSSIDKQRLEKLVDLALEANFNILRIWGGGQYAGNDLLDLCDEKGLVVWHDFLFACAEYPGDNLEFYNSVKEEVTWAVREFAHHPSLIVWCGNNELEWGTFSWGYVSRGKTVPDYVLYHHLIPVIIKKENPEMFYWPSSPYSENYEEPTSPTTGDQHPWNVSLGPDGPDFYAYRNFVDRFPNEGGYLGASSPATLRQFMQPDELYLRSVTWDHHDNEVNFWGDKDVTYSSIEYWLGKSYKKMSFDDYLFGSALLQAEALTEYISNYHRRMFSSSSAIFWMYNDSWPVTHGWAIVDYYLRKKLAYYPVKRAFNPVSIVITSEGDKINFYGVNDSPADWKGQLRYGVFGIKGGLPVDEKVEVKLPTNHSTLLKSIEKSEWTKLGIDTHGAFAILTSREGKPVNQYKLLLTKFKDIDFAKPKISVVRNGEFAEFSSPAFVWGVSIDVNGEAELSDNCFDLIPNVPYKIVWPKDKQLPVVIRTGNELILK